MALQKQTLPVVFRTGADTKSDSKAITGQLLDLQNAVMDKPGEVRKRNGFQPLAVLAPAISARGATSAQYNPADSEFLFLDTSTSVLNAAVGTRVTVNIGTGADQETVAGVVYNNSGAPPAPGISGCIIYPIDVPLQKTHDGFNGSPVPYTAYLESQLFQGVMISGFGSELLAGDGESLFAYNSNAYPADPQFISRGALPAVDIRTTELARSEYSELAPDLAIDASGARACVWEESGIVYASVFTATGTALVRAKLLQTLSSRPRIVATSVAGAEFQLFWINGTNLITATMSLSGTVAQTTTLSTSINMANGPVYDCCGDATASYVVFPTITGYGLKVIQNGTVLHSKTVTLATVPFRLAIWFSATVGTLTDGLMVASAQGSDLYVTLYNPDPTYSLTPTRIATADKLVHVSGCADASGVNRVWATYATAAASASRALIYDSFISRITYTIPCDGTYTPAEVCRGVSLASKPFVFASRTCAAVNYQSKKNLQNLILVMDSAGTVLAKASGAGQAEPFQYLAAPTVTATAPGGSNHRTFQFTASDGFVESAAAQVSCAYTNAGDVVSFTWLPVTGAVFYRMYGYDSTSATHKLLAAFPGPFSCRSGDYVVTYSYYIGASCPVDGGERSTLPQVTVAEGVASLPWLKGIGLSSFGSVLTITNGVDFLTLTETTSIPHLATSRCLFTGGGLTRAYDGQAITESGFYVSPEEVSVTGYAYGTGHTYSYIFLYEWTDAKGLVHQSQGLGNPMAATTIVTSAPLGPTNVATIFSNTTAPILSSKTGVRLVTYRTLDTGTTFYRVSNDFGLQGQAGSNLLYDGVTDALLATTPQIYSIGQAGGELANHQPPPASAFCAWGNRVWLVDALNRNTVWFSKEAVPDVPYEFSSELTVTVDSDEEITGLGVLDSALFVFTKNHIYYTTGSGPDSTGQNGAFIFSSVASDAGCINPRSIVPLNDRIFFQSAKGLYSIDRGMSVTYSGAAAEGYLTGNTITGATLSTTGNRVLWTLDNSTVIVFDYSVGQWGRWTQIGAADITVTDGKLAYIDSQGQVQVETPGAYVDPASAWIPLSLTTSWLQPAQVQNWGRNYRLLILGEYRSESSFTVNFYFDFDEDVGQTQTIQLGTDSPGVGSVMQQRIGIAQQLCEAMKVKITDGLASTVTETIGPPSEPGGVGQVIETTTYGPVGEGIRLSSLNLELGIKKGAYKKLPASQSH